MRDLDKALSDIVAIRSQIAAGTAFQGYGPAAVATTGGLAFLTATAQAVWLGETAEPVAFLACWIATACLAALVIGAEMAARSRRHHSGLADALLHHAVEQFLPSLAAGAMIGLVLVRLAPDTVWMLPGLWQLLAGLGLFAALRSLPGPVKWAAIWYVAAGLCVLMLGARTRALSPWTMGLPFTAGQILLACLLRVSEGGVGEETDG